jgi:hypothetical protein
VAVLALSKELKPVGEKLVFSRGSLSRIPLHKPIHAGCPFQFVKKLPTGLLHWPSGNSQVVAYSTFRPW